MIPAGRLNRRVTIEKPNRVPGAMGEQAITWVPLVEVYASIRPLSGNEVVKARAAKLETTHKIRMRYTAMLTADCRLSYPITGRTEPRILNISQIINIDDLNREFEITAVEVANG